VRTAFEEIGREAYRAGFWVTLLRGIFAGWLIAVMVWMLPAAESAHVAVILIVTYIVGLGGFAHIVAGSVDAMYMAVIGRATWAEYLGAFMVPTLLGNVVGGVTIVAALNHAQVVAGEKGGRP
jgi:formate/nitrite transporter FocA (FNT family)